MIHSTTHLTPRGMATRTQIITAAYQICEEKGLHAIHTRSVAIRANINVSTLHYYFPTKHDLLLALLEWVLARFAEKTPSPTTLSDELRSAVSWVSTEPGMLAVWYDFWNLSRTDSHVKHMIHDHLLKWRAHLASLLADNHSTADSTVFLALALGLPVVAAALPEASTTETLQAAVNKWLAPNGSPRLNHKYER
ncbi:TetR/AcrR family transcriptional regulator [Sulfobacillus sp. hq2]|uniref:TetR/AcrR family transcriptional regulator n=1 Tax=Sulfobacillus sp. hq2 TaxID=2039167 RepID=UPI000CD290A6|nr:TetR/AcrR family transcriptional regulator [Sulfobacillus sp. hq2]POB09611.1 hypothetical protein CO251_15500 [Sulfobacillus sp. hq2]